MSELRTSLKALTGIESDPFNNFNKANGWNPRFRLIDDRNNADDQAKKAAVHVSPDDLLNYDEMGDEADKWIEENQ